MRTPSVVVTYWAPGEPPAARAPATSPSESELLARGGLYARLYALQYLPAGEERARA